MKLQLIDISPVTVDILTFKFKPESDIIWLPGQYMHYILPHVNPDDRGIERWFTNSAAPSDKFVAITTRIDKFRSSSFKKYLQTLKPGDKIDADGPEGDFTINDEKRNYIFVAGGIGITPFHSILKEAFTQNKRLNVTLIYANRNNDIPFKDELEQFSQANPNLRLEFITKPQRVDLELLIQHISKVENPLVYISGPEPMVKSLAEQLKNSGFSNDSIKLDDFPGYEAD